MNSKIKKGLGRGLSSLIGETKVESKTNKLNLSEIIPNKYQPRKNFDEDNLEDLSNSIKERGVIQPIIVRRSDSDDAKYEATKLEAGTLVQIKKQNNSQSEQISIIKDTETTTLKFNGVNANTTPNNVDNLFDNAE